jgi:TetR/AcrR family transcriptional regulator
MESTGREAGTGRGGADTAREDLLDAAERVFAQRGFEATGLREITGQAGVAHGMIRHHFGSKEGLWRAVADRAVERYRAALAPHAAIAGKRPGDTRAATRAAVRAFLDVNARHPELLRLTLHESVRGGTRLDYLLQHCQPVAALMAPLFRQAQQAGYLRQFDQRSFLLFLLTAGAMPFALPALATGLLGSPLQPGSAQARQHADRILDTLYGPEPPAADDDGADVR